MRRTPKLRFPEFSGEWEEKRLGEIGKISMCKRIMKEETFPNGEIPFYKIGTFGKQADAYIKKEKYEEYKARYSFPKIGDILVSASGTIGRTVRYDGKPAYFQDSNIVWIDNNKKLVLNNFLYQCYNNVKWTTEDTTIARLYNDNFKNMVAFFPSLPEQEKIANFLSKVDEKIELLERKKELWEEYKKGAMQKIFSQEIRFKDEDGNEYPQWEEKRLGEIVKLQGGYAFKSDLFKKEGVPIIRISNISNYNNYINTDNLIYYDKIKNDTNFMIQKGDLLIAMSGATTGKLSVFNLEENAYLNQRVGLFKLLENETYYKYLVQFCFSKEFSSQLGGVLATGAQPNISSKDIEEFIIKLPTLPEQEKIANYLSSIDSKIEIVSKELEVSKEFKKGLLQGMFV